MRLENWVEVAGRMEDWLQLIERPLEHYFEGQLKSFGLEHLLAAVLSLVLTWVTVRGIRMVLVPEPAPDLRALDPDDDRAVEAAFRHLGYVAKVEAVLGEPVADSLEGFRRQIRRTGQYAGPGLWSKLDPNDIALMQDLLARNDLVERLAQSVGVQPPRDIEELQRIVRMQQGRHSEGE